MYDMYIRMQYFGKNTLICLAQNSLTTYLLTYSHTHIHTHAHSHMQKVLGTYCSMSVVQ